MDIITITGERRPGMTVEDLIKRKKELAYTNEMISERSGVPLGTVQKIFGGITSRPRYNTLQSIQCVLFPEDYSSKETKLYREIAENLARDNYTACSVSESSALDEYCAELPVKEHKAGFEKILSWKKQGEYTVDDWRALPEGVRMELIDGVLYDMASPTKYHQFIAAQLYVELSKATIDRRKKCLPFIAPLGVQIDKDNKSMLQPDIMLVCSEDKYKEKNELFGAPDFVAEVLSPSTEKYDRIKKLNKYWKAGVREYWIINIEDEEIIAYQFEKGLPVETYSFEDRIPLGISEGDIIIDFRRISESMHSYFG